MQPNPNGLPWVRKSETETFAGKVVAVKSGRGVSEDIES